MEHEAQGRPSTPRASDTHGMAEAVLRCLGLSPLLGAPPFKRRLVALAQSRKRATASAPPHEMQSLIPSTHITHTNTAPSTQPTCYPPKAAMFVKRAILLAVLLVGAFAQDDRELAVSKANEKGEIKVVKNADNVDALAKRWSDSLIAGWNTTATVNTARILGSTLRTAP